MSFLEQVSERVISQLRAFFFAADRDIKLASGKDLYLEDGTNVGDTLDSQFVTMATTGNLANERKLTAGTGINLADGGAGGNATLSVDESEISGLDAQFVVMSTTANLSNERQLTAGDGLDLSDGGAGGNATLDVDVTDIIDTAAGLTESSNNIQVNLGTGLTFDGGGAIQVVATTGHIVQEEGGDLPQETYLNFTGAFVTAADDAGNNATTVEILEDTQDINTFLAGPASGSPAKPTFRAIAAADLGTPTDNYVLVADSVQSNGMKWADVGEVGGVPSGGVIFWPSTAGAIPSGWTTFSAAAGKFLVGADGGTFTNGSTGGAETVDLSHTHGSGTLGTDSDNHSHTSGTLATDSDGHSHGAGTLDTDNDSHSHGSGTLDTDSDSHSHGAGSVGGGGFLSGSLFTAQNGSDTTAIAVSHIHSPSGTTDSDGHDHGVDSGSTASDSHDHAVNAGSTASDSHSHGVNSGSTGSDSHSHAVDSGATDTALSATQSILPPYLVGSWIQRS